MNTYVSAQLACSACENVWCSRKKTLAYAGLWTLIPQRFNGLSEDKYHQALLKTYFDQLGSGLFGEISPPDRGRIS